MNLLAPSTVVAENENACILRKCDLFDSMTSEQIKAAGERYSKAQRIDFFLQILGGSPSCRRDFSQELRYRGRQMVFLSDALKAQGYQYIQADSHRYIYRLAACGYTYIGQTNDPFARYVDHLISTETSCVVLATAAIDNGLVPRMEIVDITDETSSNGVEGFWIRYAKWKKGDVVNVIQNNDEFARFVEQNGDGFRSVIASQIMGYEASTFPAFLVEHSCPPISMQSLMKKFIPPWLAA